MDTISQRQDTSTSEEHLEKLLASPCVSCSSQCPQVSMAMTSRAVDTETFLISWSQSFPPSTSSRLSGGATAGKPCSSCPPVSSLSVLLDTPEPVKPEEERGPAPSNPPNLNGWMFLLSRARGTPGPDGVSVMAALLLLAVVRGRLQVSVSPAEDCKAEVVSNEPVTQRGVGGLLGHADGDGGGVHGQDG